jgi:hypothetical protein
MDTQLCIRNNTKPSERRATEQRQTERCRETAHTQTQKQRERDVTNSTKNNWETHHRIEQALPTVCLGQQSFVVAEILLPSDRVGFPSPLGEPSGFVLPIVASPVKKDGDKTRSETLTKENEPIAEFFASFFDGEIFFLPVHFEVDIVLKRFAGST